MKSILLVDNHDSFTWNLAELLRQNRKITFTIFRPENLKPDEIEKYDKIIFSPGPGLPDEFPMMKRILEHYYKTKPVLCVCLGHQVIGQFFGARLVHLKQVVHGQVRHLQITKPGNIFFAGSVRTWRSGYIIRGWSSEWIFRDHSRFSAYRKMDISWPCATGNTTFAECSSILNRSLQSMGKN